MILEIKVPVLPESVADATLLAWRKRPGEQVKSGEHLTDLETDKVTLEVTSPADGALKEVLKQEGETAQSQEVLAIIDTAPLHEEVAEGEVATAPQTLEAAEPAPQEAQPSEAPAADPQYGPAVRRLLEEHGLDAATVALAGKGGRVTKADVLGYLGARTKGQPPAAPAAVAAAEPVTAAPSERPERRMAMSQLRRRIAERLLTAQHEHAILTTFNEVNMKPVLELRERFGAEFEEQHGVKLGFMSFFCKACLVALKRYPVVNASIDGQDIVYHDYFDLGIAVSAARGLVVPVIRNAERLTLGEIERQIQALAEKARESKLSIEELSGGTFTITNGGVFGSLLSTPIINPPQSAILGMHRIQARPIAEGGQAVVRPMMYLALSYDHRIIDGREAVRFLVTVRQQIENPARMLLEI